MSVERSVPSAQRSPAFDRGVILAFAFGVLVGAGGVLLYTLSQTHARIGQSAEAPGGARVAFTRESPCEQGTCTSLWLGAARDSATEVTAYRPGTCSELSWTRDGTRVACVLGGVQLDIYNAESLAPAGRLRLIPESDSASRLARGVTFSENGRAVTFDDCPRSHSGCRPSLVAVPELK
jgi:hypothetical protein